jgi:DNA-directed RNA polymerase specialized sigma24 family protein
MSDRALRSRTPRQRAERTAQAHYRSLEKEVVGVVGRRLSARNMRLDSSDLEEAYCLAWHGVYEEIKRGTKIANLTGMLVEITWRRAVDTYRGLQTGQHADVDIDAHGVEVDLDEQLDDQQKLQRFIKRLKRRLSWQECQAVSLCLIHGYSRPEARELLGIEDEERMQKLMDRAMRKIGGIVAGIDARGCGGDEWACMLRAYALGLLGEDERDYRRASEHIEDCASCRRYVLGLRGLAAIVPPVGLPLMPVGGHETSILAHLERLFGGHGSASATASSALQGTATAGGASAAGGGAGAIGSLGGAKVAAVLVVAAVAGAAAVHVSDTHHHPAARHAHVARAAPAGASLLARGPYVPAGVATRAELAGEQTRHAGVRRGGVVAAGRSTVVQREFGFEGERASRTTSPPPVPRVTASTASISGNTSPPASNVGAVQREFGPER